MHSSRKWWVLPLAVAVFISGVLSVVFWPRPSRVDTPVLPDVPHPNVDALALGSPDVRTSTNAIQPGKEASSPAVVTGTPADDAAGGATRTPQTPQTSQNPAPTPEQPRTDRTPFRAVWVATVQHLDYPSTLTKDPTSLKAEALRILDGAADLGMTAVILQVRPAGDAFYPSDLFPWSAYLTGEQGVAPDDGFDPLAFWVTEAHKRKLELHAWINPFRVTTGGSAAAPKDLSMLAATNPARKNPSWVIPYKDGNLYYNPGLPDTRRLIVNGVTELVRRYDIDGIHFDDYFYPGRDFPDDNTYLADKRGFADKDDWRRDNINILIQNTQKAIRDLKPNCRFGISPAGVWANKSEMAMGSDTRGQPTYSVHYADTRRWVKSGFIDYICPQIYWEIGYEPADFAVLLKWWMDVVKGTNVSLYVGHAAYRSGTSEKPGDPWYGADEMLRQLDMEDRLGGVDGDAFFRYSFFVDNPVLANAIRQRYRSGAGAASNGVSPTPSASPDAPLPGETPTAPPFASLGGAALRMPEAAGGALSLGRPNAEEASTTEKNYYILGVSDPKQPLLMNGKPVARYGTKGFFGVFVPLDGKTNTFTFTQGAQSVTRVIRRKSDASEPASMSEATIPESSCVPYGADEYRQPGETITLQCTAPIGAAVSVSLGGATHAMTPAITKKPNKEGYFSTTYTYTYTTPNTDVKGKIVKVGAPVYTAEMDGRVIAKRTARAIHCLTEGALYFAEVTAENTYVYPKATTSGGPSGELCRGQRAPVTGVTGGGDWVRLQSIGWVPGSAVFRFEGESALRYELVKAVYSRANKWDALTLSGAEHAATTVSYDAKKLTLRVYNVTAAPATQLPAGTPFASVVGRLSGSTAEYTLTLKEGARIDGFYVYTGSDALTLRIKQTLQARGGASPLTGFFILLDPGHGGDEPGALGPPGASIPEKTVNLYTALKVRKELQAMGATVMMTRENDKTVSLAERVEISRSYHPDLFLSIHGNSLDPWVDASDVRGLSTWYRETVSKPFAETLYEYIPAALGRQTRGCKQSNLFVARPDWTPSVIVETGFLCNPEEAEWMIDNAAQDKLAAAIAGAVRSYFR